MLVVPDSLLSSTPEKAGLCAETLVKVTRTGLWIDISFIVTNAAKIDCRLRCQACNRQRQVGVHARHLQSTRDFVKMSVLSPSKRCITVHDACFVTFYSHEEEVWRDILQRFSSCHRGYKELSVIAVCEDVFVLQITAPLCSFLMLQRMGPFL